MDLFGAYLRDFDAIDAHLQRANLSAANIHYANLTGADLRGADLSDADLSRAGLSSTQLVGADLRGANLGGAELSEARLRGANLGGAVLYYANFSGAICRRTSFGDVDLSEVSGLDSIKHEGPSTVGVDTLFSSQGKIPETFLRGCGVPDALNVQQRALLGALEPIQFYSCFISYSTKNQDFAERLHGKMSDKRL